MGGLAKGLGVLQTFSKTRPHMTLSEIAARAGLPAATARRCLNTLEELGFVSRNGRQFVLRPRVLQIGAVYLDSMDIQALTRNLLEEVVQETGGSAAFAVLSGTDAVFVARATAPTATRVEAHVGSHFPAHATAMGRVLLTGLSAERLAEYFDRARLERFTDRTITDKTELQRRIDESRRSGYVVAEDELTTGLVALAVPVRDAAGRIVAALNVAVNPRQTSASELVTRHLPTLQRVAQAISAEIARVPGLSLSAQV